MSPKRITALFSGGASSLKYLLENDRNYGITYKFVGAFSSKNGATGIALCRENGIPVKIIDFKDFSAQEPPGLDPQVKRERYFEAVSRVLAPFKSDLLILSGFMLIVTDPLLTEYKERILNVHPADLTITDQSGKRKYTGADAVTLALKAGETSTRSTVHVVTSGIDEGPIIALSDPLPVEPGIDPKTHQERMKVACDGPAYARALEKLCKG